MYGIVCYCSSFCIGSRNILYIKIFKEMVDNTLVHFKTKENFKREKGNIQDTSIAFIKDSK
jgi:hypothetical protein